MIRSDTACFFFTALLLLILPIRWVISAATAAMIHEAYHILALWLLKEKIRSVRFSFCACVIETYPMEDWKKFCSILAGPAGSFSLLLLRQCVPMIAVCGFFHGFYNLLPILPLDGGRLLQLLLYRFCPEKADRILSVMGIIVVMLMASFGVYLAAAVI